MVVICIKTSDRRCRDLFSMEQEAIVMSAGLEPYYGSHVCSRHVLTTCLDHMPPRIFAHRAHKAVVVHSFMSMCTSGASAAWKKLPLGSIRGFRVNFAEFPTLAFARVPTLFGNSYAARRTIMLAHSSAISGDKLIWCVRLSACFFTGC
jgi:hypothetical protein